MKLITCIRRSATLTCTSLEQPVLMAWRKGPEGGDQARRCDAYIQEREGVGLIDAKHASATSHANRMGSSRLRNCADVSMPSERPCSCACLPKFRRVCNETPVGFCWAASTMDHSVSVPPAASAEEYDSLRRSTSRSCSLRRERWRRIRSWGIPDSRNLAALRRSYGYFVISQQGLLTPRAQPSLRGPQIE